MLAHKQEYDRLLSQYRGKQRELRSAEKKNLGSEWIQYIDKERDALHKELTRIGGFLHKNSQRVS